MSKEITKAFILQEIQDKFQMRELIPEKFSFSEEVVPVYDIEKHCLKRNVERETLSITSMSAYKFFTVPQDERWTIRAYTVIFLTGVYTVAGVFVQRGIVDIDYIYLDLKAAQSVSYLVNLVSPVICDPGDPIKVNIDGYTSTGDLRLILDVVKESIR